MTVEEIHESIKLEDGRTLRVTYVLSKSYSPEFLCDTYAVTVTTENTDETVTVRDLTSEPETAERIFGKIVRGRVTAVTLRYILEDML